MAVGKVILAGAGCGSEELITLKLQRCLQTADVIIADRLVNPSIVEIHANKHAEIIIAGKQGYNSASLVQQQVTQLIIQHALLGKAVLRLKGGDVAFFSNVLHELEALKQHQISYEIIPGITAASGASAYAGIPLTARGYAQAVQIITFNPNNKTEFTAQKWQQLANTTDTIVVYMGATYLTELVQHLISHQIKGSTPIAVIEQATTAAQKVHISTIQNCLQQFKQIDFSSPSLIIIGQVVNLHQTFNWFTAQSVSSVFPSI